MAIKSADQISIVDLTDGYSVILTSDGYTFPGTTTAAKAGSCTTQIIAMCGSEQVAAKVDLNSITKPTGITVTKDNNATSPTLTIMASTSFTTAGFVTIPVLVDGDITITKKFAVSIAFTGATGGKGDKGDTGDTGKGVASVTITYQGSTSNTTAPTGTWQSSPPSVTQGQYLWTRLILRIRIVPRATLFTAWPNRARLAALAQRAAGGIRAPASRAHPPPRRSSPAPASLPPSLAICI